MKSDHFARKVRAPQRKPSAGRKTRRKGDVDPQRSAESGVDAEVATALPTPEQQAERSDAPQGSMEDPLGDWPEGGSSGNDEWLRERGDAEGSSSS